MVLGVWWFMVGGGRLVKGYMVERGYSCMGICIGGCVDNCGNCGSCMGIYVKNFSSSLEVLLL